MKHHQTDPALRDALLTHRTSRGLTNHQLGKLLSVSATFISKYIGDKLDHDPGDFDKRAWDTLRAIAAKLDQAATLFETSVTRAIIGRIDMARRTSDLCLIHGVAGEGKTSAALLYQANQPSTIYWKATGKASDAGAVQSGLFAAIGPALKSADYQATRWSIITGCLRGSQRAVIVDNAHRLTRSGIDYLCDLNEDTGVGVILLGNPEILKRIKANDQQFSRIGVAGEASYETPAGLKELPAVAQRVCALFSNEDFAECVSDLVAFTAQKPGRLRAVRKTTILAFEMQSKLGGDSRSFYRRAHSQLVRDYALPSD